MVMYNLGLIIETDENDEIVTNMIIDALNTCDNYVHNDSKNVFLFKILPYNIDRIIFLHKLIGFPKQFVIDYISNLRYMPEQTLKFIGNGSWYNQSVPNTSAYIKLDDTMLLIDCGESIYKELVNNDLLNGINMLYVYITHNHSDHAGSLASLVLRCKYSWNIDVKVMTYTDNVKSLKRILKSMGCECDVESVIVKTIKTENESIVIRAFEVDHTKDLTCSAIDIKTNNKRLLYTGDINRYIGDYVDVNIYDEIYTDCSTSYKSNAHVHLDTLDKVVEPIIRHKFFCMHLDGTHKQILEKGFNCANTII